jgi:ribosomal protein S18 acetylase RimI-like enzyme
MSKKPAPTTFRIEPASVSDWPWILQGEVEIAWARLGPRGRQEVDRHTVVERTAKRVSQLRQDVGFPNRAFLARTEDGTLAGYVWVAKTHNDFTGRLEASLLNQYVAEPYRGEGLGHRLMETAEDWALQQGLPRISLCVGAQNAIGRRLYESLGYHAEALRMTKPLIPQQDEWGMAAE